MAYTVGHCLRADYCGIAASKRDVLINGGDPFVCPECGQPLKPVSVTAGGGNAKGSSTVLIAAGLAIVALAGAGAGIFLLRPTNGPAVALQAAAPAAMSAPAAPGSVAGAPIVQTALPQPVAPAGDILLRISGFNAATMQLAPRLAAAYLNQSGDTDISTSDDPAAKTKTVSGMHGRTRESIIIETTGIAQKLQDLASHKVDIIILSRRVTPTERQNLAGDVGDLYYKENEHVLALDGIAVVVNPANPLREITIAQLRAIYSGAVHDWSELGGAAGPITVWSRPPGSGTRDTFLKKVLGDALEVPIAAAHKVDNGPAIVAGVNADPNAIAYLDFINAGASRALAVQDTGAQPLLPTQANIATEEYPLSRRLYFYHVNAPTNAFVRAFTDFIESSSGQQIVGEAGFVSKNVQQVAAVAPATASDRYRQIVQGASRLSVDFHFKPGSNTLDSASYRDFERVVALLASKHVAADKLMLLGFADNTGSPATNAAIAKERVEAVAAMFARRRMAPGVVESFAAEAPIADNDTEEGREKNRRVEVYLRS